MKTTSSENGGEQVVHTNCLYLVLTFRTIFVHNMFSPCSAKKRASDKDLPVQWNVVVKRYRDLKSESPGKDNDD